MLKCQCEESKPYIFVSYSHKDSTEVHEIISRMYENGYNVWFDEGIDPGTEWDENIASHVEKAKHLIAFLSENYITSKNCRDELNYARDKDIDSLIVYLKNVKLSSGMEMRLGRLQAIFKYRYDNISEFLEKLFSVPMLLACKCEEKLYLNSSTTNDESLDIINTSDAIEAKRILDIFSHNECVFPVLFIVDTSGSMNGERIWKVNRALNNFIAQAAHASEQKFIISIVSFSTTVETEQPFALASDIYSRHSSINLEAAGSTSLGAGLIEAKKIIEDCLPQNAISPLVVLFSDGEPTDCWEKPMQDFINTGRSAKCERLVMSICDDDNWNNTLKTFAQNEDMFLTSDKSDELCDKSDELWTIANFIALRQSLDMYEKLASENPATYLPDLACSQNNLAIFYDETGKLNEAKVLYQNALNIRQKLASENPATYSPCLAESQNNLAGLYDKIGKLADAELLYQHALDIYKKLGVETPAVYSSDLIKSFITIAFLHIKMKKLSTATQNLNDAVESLCIYEELIDDFDLSQLAVRCIHLCETLHETAKPEIMTKAEQYHIKIMDLMDMEQKKWEKNFVEKHKNGI